MELGVSPATVRRACDAGVLKCRRSPGGHRRFERAALQGMTRDRLLVGGRDGDGGQQGVLRALADLGEAASRWRDTDELLRMDAKTQMEVLEQSKGKLTVNEQRRRLTERLIGAVKGAPKWVQAGVVLLSGGGLIAILLDWLSQVMK